MNVDRRTLMIGLPAGLLCGCNGVATSRQPAAARAVRPDLYQCEGCEGALERSPSSLTPNTAMAPPGEPGEPMSLVGRVLNSDGVTPAAGVIIYAYQTNAAGLYAGGSSETEASRRHGRLRGWVRTGADGRYRFSTIKPAPYPRDTMPAHIHFTILESGRRPYWIDDIVFDGEFGVTPAYRGSMTDKGGNGIVRLTRAPDGELEARRDIILERHPG